MPYDGSNLSPVTKTLIEGREAIERGWTQGKFCDRSTGAVCMLGAIRWRSGQLIFGEGGALDRLVAAIGDRSVANWNDAPGRTKEEVLAAFDRAIAMED